MLSLSRAICIAFIFYFIIYSCPENITADATPRSALSSINLQQLRASQPEIMEDEDFFSNYHPGETNMKFSEKKLYPSETKKLVEFLYDNPIRLLIPTLFIVLCFCVVSGPSTQGKPSNSGTDNVANPIERPTDGQVGQEGDTGSGRSLTRNLDDDHLDFEEIEKGDEKITASVMEKRLFYRFKVFRYTQPGYYFPPNPSLEKTTMYDLGYDKDSSYELNMPQQKCKFRNDRDTKFHVERKKAIDVVNQYKEFGDIVLILNISNGLKEEVPAGSLSQEPYLRKQCPTLGTLIEEARAKPYYMRAEHLNKNSMLYFSSVFVGDPGRVSARLIEKNVPKVRPPLRVDILTLTDDISDAVDLDRRLIHQETTIQKMTQFLYIAAMAKADILILPVVGTGVPGVNLSAIINGIVNLCVKDFPKTFKKVIFILDENEAVNQDVYDTLVHILQNLSS